MQLPSQSLHDHRRTHQHWRLPAAASGQAPARQRWHLAFLCSCEACTAKALLALTQQTGGTDPVTAACTEYCSKSRRHCCTGTFLTAAGGWPGVHGAPLCWPPPATGQPCWHWPAPPAAPAPGWWALKAPRQAQPSGFAAAHAPFPQASDDPPHSCACSYPNACLRSADSPGPG